MLRHDFQVGECGWMEDEEEETEDKDGYFSKLSLGSSSIGFLADRPSSSLYRIVFLKCFYFIIIYIF